MSRNSDLTTKWKKLRNAISDKQGLTLFDEAEKCFMAKAYRMAYIAIWITIAESLKNTFKVMAEKDNAIYAIVRMIEMREASHYPPDKLILEKAKDVGVLNDVAYQKIEPILTMRNIYAHPYNVGPGPDEVYHVAKIAVDEVLSVPPLLRKSYIDGLLEKLQTNRHYMDDVEEKVVKVALEVSSRIAPSLRPYLLKGLFYRLNEVIGDPDRILFANRLIWFTQACIKSIKPDFTQPKWRLRNKIDDFPLAVSKVLSTIELWDFVPEEDNIQDSIVSFLLFPEENGIEIIPEPWAIKRIYLLSQERKLSERQEERFRECLKGIKPGIMAKADIPLSYYAEEIITALASHNWYVQNPAASALWNAGSSKMVGLSEDTLEGLGRNILQSAQGNASDSIDFIEKTISSAKKWPKFFVRGLLFECFLDEKKNFRCKERYAYQAIIIAIRYCESETIDLFDKLLEDLEYSKEKENFYWPSSGTAETIELVSKLVDELLPPEKTLYEDKLLSLIKMLKDIQALVKPPM